jgi:thymidylate synthase
VAYVFSEQTLDDLMHVALDALIQHGEPVVPAPTKNECVELVGVALELTNPRARVSRSATRGRLLSAIGELTWYLSGSNDTDHIAHYIRYYEQLDEDGVVYGGYGPRLFAYDGVNQVQNVIAALTANRSTRRAVVQLFDRHDVAARRKEVPCTCTLQYLLRNDTVHAITHMRSNDAYLGLPHDIFCFTMLQELIACSVGAEVGTYQHLVGSFHLYDRDRDEARAFLDEGWHTTKTTMPNMPPGDPWPAVTRLLAVEASLRRGASPADTRFDEDPYWGDLERLVAVHELRNGPADQLMAIRQQLASRFYDIYVGEFLDRLAGR